MSKHPVDNEGRMASLVKVLFGSMPAKPVDPDEVFRQVEKDRKSGELAKKVTTAWPRYSLSNTHPGYLEEHCADGSSRVGTFNDGKFTPLDNGSGNT